ncbi:MFS transporter [Eubacteriales bacterium OttesenSCG-928-M02]|nr:MFS transporter [Eubacteriales bacterium OttesenSCG-928-M02]
MQEHKKTQLRINLLEFFYFAGTFAGSFFPTVLKTSGMDSVAVATVMSINASIGFVSPAIFALIADKIGSPRKTFFFTLVTTSILWLGIPISMNIKAGTFPVLVLFVLMGSFFRMPTGGLLDSWILQIQAARPKVIYAHARKYGSLGYAVMSMLSTLIVRWWGVGAIFYILILLVPLILFLGTKVGDPPAKEGLATAPAGERNKLELGRIFKNYSIITHVLCLVVTWMPFTLSYMMLPYLADAIGQDSSILGTLFGVRALIEVPAFMLVPLLARKFKPQMILPVCFGYYVVEEFLLAGTHTMGMLITIMMVSGLIYGIAVGTNINYVHSLAPPGLKTTVVTINAAANSAANIIGNQIVGQVIKHAGIRVCYMVIGSMTAVAVCMMILFFYIGKKRNMPLLQG